MKARKVFNMPLLLLVFLGAAFVLWQIILTSVKDFNQHPGGMVNWDISALKKISLTRSTEKGESIPSLQHLDYSLTNSLSIQLDRNLPDTRDARCKCPSSKVQLPSTSVVITYREVDRSVLLRNIASIIQRSKGTTIKEIILVDDGSSDAKAGELLQQSHAQSIKVLRNKVPSGRGTARTQGAKVASGEVIVFIDCLSEMNIDWLCPLLHRLVESPKSLVAPTFDVIDPDTFNYKSMTAMLRGGIDWSLQFQWVELPPKSRSSPSSDFFIPFRSPIQLGAVFAVRRDFFSWLGKYDTSFGASGVEDIDLSLRAWLCGGQVEIVPCSRVGLIQTSRKHLGVQRVPFSSYLRGAKKIAELWLDEYKRFFYAVRPSARMQPLSNLTSSRRLREKNKCVGFKWFLSSIYPQLLPLVSDEIAFGTIRQQDNCVDLDPGQMPLIAKVRPCKDGKDSQEWSWRKKGMIVSNGMCLTSDLDTMHGFVVVQFCKDLSSQGWYRTGLKIVHQESNFCLDSKSGDRGLVITTCVDNLVTQNWQISSEVASQSRPEYDFSFSEDKAQL